MFTTARDWFLSVQVQGPVKHFIRCRFLYGGELLDPSTTPKREDRPLSAVRNCLFNVFTAIFIVIIIFIINIIIWWQNLPRLLQPSYCDYGFLPARLFEINATTQQPSPCLVMQFAGPFPQTGLESALRIQGNAAYTKGYEHNAFWCCYCCPTSHHHLPFMSLFLDPLLILLFTLFSSLILSSF